jgi:hypothetical protein
MIMKNLFLFLAFSSFSMFLSSCEKTESEHAKHERLGVRAPDCSECDPEHCCCIVELVGLSPSADLKFCGTTNPDISTNVCGPIALQDCPPISGFEWTETLMPGAITGNEFFCVEKGTSFMLGVGAGPTSIRFTCQYGATSPQWTYLNLTAGEKHYYTVDEGCEVEECHLE